MRSGDVFMGHYSQPLNIIWPCNPISEHIKCERWLMGVCDGFGRRVDLLMHFRRADVRKMGPTENGNGL